MWNLLQIEWRKLAPYRVFRVLGILYVLGFVGTVFGVKTMVLALGNNFGNEFTKEIIDGLFLGMFDFPSIWMNMAMLGKFVQYLVGFILTALICGELANSTFKQNIIDGMSRGQLVLSKLMLVLIFTVFSFLLFCFTGLLVGSLGGADASVFKQFQYAFNFLLYSFAFLSFTTLVCFLVKRSGLVIIILVVYPLIEWFISYQLSKLGSINDFLPFRAMWNLTQTLDSKGLRKANFDLQENPITRFLPITITYIFVFWTAIMLWVKRRDY